MKFVSDKFWDYWKRMRDFCVYKVLHADDPPHRLAMGIATAMFVTFTPFIGLQMVLAVFLAWLLGGNKLVGIPLVWLSNPFTIIPIYYPSYLLGCSMLGGRVVAGRWKQLGTEWRDLISDPATTWRAKIDFWWDGFVDFFLPLFLGSAVVATVVGVLSYYLSLHAIRTYRLRRWGQLMPPRLTPREEEEEKEPAIPPSQSSSGENAA